MALSASVHPLILISSGLAVIFAEDTPATAAENPVPGEYSFAELLCTLTLRCSLLE